MERLSCQLTIMHGSYLLSILFQFKDFWATSDPLKVSESCPLKEPPETMMKQTVLVLFLADLYGLG